MEFLWEIKWEVLFFIIFIIVIPLAIKDIIKNIKLIKNKREGLYGWDILITILSRLYYLFPIAAIFITYRMNIYHYGYEFSSDYHFFKILIIIFFTILLMIESIISGIKEKVNAEYLIKESGEDS